MKAIILTAGFGKRMRPLTGTTHKTLLKIQDRTVIQWIVDALLENGINDIVVITGYQAEELRAHLAEAYPALRITYIHNERYARTNNICSMALALEQVVIDSDVVLIECDLVFHPAVIRRLLASPHPNIALVDRYRSGMDGTVVTVSGSVITEVIPPQRQGAGFLFSDKYKTLNIYRFSREFCAGPFRKLLSYYASVVSDNVYYELVLGIIIYLQHATIHAELLDGEKWAELDDPNDVNLAQFQFDPSIRRSTLAESFGGYWNYDILDFCFIRNMHFPTDSILSELRGNLPALIHNYSSSQAIIDRKMAFYLLCRPEHLITLNGASQAYPWLRSYFAVAKVLIPKPTFGEYSRIFPDAAFYSDDVGLDRDEIAGQTESSEVVVLVNPNNPTGSVLPTAWIHALASAHPDRLFVVDESFIDFSGQPGLLPLLEEQPLPNVILIKSLSKALGIPGLRLGFLYTSNRGFHDHVRSAMPVWNLNSMAENFLEIILKHRPDIETSFARTMEDREKFADALRELPLIKRVHPSGGNFLLVSLHWRRDKSFALTEALLQRHNIHIKDVSQRFGGTDTHLRLAVRKPEENMMLVSCLGRLPVDADGI